MKPVKQTPDPAHNHMLECGMTVGELTARASLAPAPGSSRDWTEDFNHENGMYLSQCCRCANHFYGHKRRFLCKICWDATQSSNVRTERPAGGNREP